MTGWTVNGELSEAAWQRRVEGLLRFYGWRYYHAPDNTPRAHARGRAGRQRVTPGFPDVVAIRNLETVGPELLFAELKAQSGRYGPGQREWLAALEGLRDSVDAALRTLRLNLAHYTGLVAGEPAIGVYTWRPDDEAEVERVLAGPRGVGVLIGELA